VFISKKKLIKLQAQAEGARDAFDVLTTLITQQRTGDKEIDKNNYISYEAQVNETYRMYDAISDYGGEILKGIVDTRVAFIAGEGISVYAEKKATEKYIKKFFDLNQLNGSRLISMIQTGEMEGKNLIILQPKQKEIFYKKEKLNGYIAARSFSWYINNYTIQVNKFDTDEITRISYIPKTDEMKEKTVPIKQAVYVKLGGSPDKINKTSSKIHNVLTDIENASRMKYDLRHNNHLFGKLMPYWQTEDGKEAKAINNDVQSEDWEYGKGFAGTAKFSIIGPPQGASESLTKEFLLAMKIISSDTGIPIHWLAWPELMSNRATAENMLEVINSATIKERLIWNEKFKEIIMKSMDLAIAAGLEDSNIKGDFIVKLDSVSLATIKALGETWMPLQMNDVISMGTLRSKVPGIDPGEEKKMIEKEKEENIQRIQDSMSVEKLNKTNEGKEEDENSGKNTEK
jgi:hypothetical protein